MKVITPWRCRLANRFIRAITFGYTIWPIGGRWFIFKDETGSRTTDIVYAEIAKSFYEPLVRLEPGDTVIDLGGHVGMFTIPLAKAHPDVSFHVYEPHPSNRKNLLRNLHLNRVANVLVSPLAVTSDGEPVAFHVGEEGNSGSVYARPHKAGSGAITFTQMRKGFGAVKLLKVDIEGSEFGAFTTENLHGVAGVIAEIHLMRGRSQEEGRNLESILESVPASRIMYAS